MNNAEQQIAKFLLPYSDEMKQLIQQLREYLKKLTEPTRELVFDSYNSVNIGYGFTEKAWDCYCGIIIYSKHINISFPAGASLIDKQGLLQGFGSKVRHIKVSNMEEIKENGIKTLLLEARDKALTLAIERGKQDKFKTLVKPNSGKKRRPN